MKQKAGGVLKSLMPLMVFLFAIVVATMYTESVKANRFTSPSYTIDASVGNTFGGATSSTDYKMVSSGGETIVGNGSGGSYKLTQGYVAQLEKSLQLNVQPSGLVAYYPLDEGLGIAMNDGTANNNRGSFLNNPSWVTGRIGQGIILNGTNQTATVPHSGSVNLDTVTLSVWIKTSQTPASDTPIIAKWSGSGAYPYKLDLTTSNKVAFRAFAGGITRSVFSTTSVNNNAWHHIVGVRSGGNLSLYVNGVLEESITSTLASAVNTTDLSFGNHSGSSSYFAGTLDEVKIYSRILTAQEIKAEYDAGSAGIPAGLSFVSDLVAGTPQTMAARAVIQTDAPGYNLAISQNQNLTSGGNSIGVVSNGGTLATPAAWSDGTTTGLGFSLTAASPGLDGKWGSGANYAPLPASATTFFTRSGFTAGGKDTVDIRYKIDISGSQAIGAYTNTVTYTGTLVP